MTRARALQLGLLVCKCGHPENNHFDDGKGSCARDGCSCTKLREVGQYGIKIIKNPGWIRTSRKLPPVGVDVLTWKHPWHPRKDIGRVGHWIKRHDMPDGRYWSIEGHSGGIGTKFEVKPPTHWMHLPKSPV
jgi:hypothetical protein